MPLALTGGQKLGIAVVAAAFIGFALLSSFVLPRRDPNYPGTRLRLFVVVAAGFFIAMMTAMAVLAREEEAERHAEPATETSRGATTETTGRTTTETTGGAAARGDPQAGKQVFASAGCGNCHVFEAAGSTGTIGPNLDEANPSFEEAVRQIEEGGGGMPPFKDQLSDEQIRNVAAFVVESRGGS